MKKLFSLLFLCGLLNFSAMSQTFRGIKVGMSPEETKKAFIAKGLLKVTHTPGKYVSAETKEGYTVVALISRANSRVYSIAQGLEDRYNYDDIKSDFNELLETISEKYGEPEVVNKRHYPYELGNQDFEAFLNKKAEMYAYFEPKDNTIVFVSVVLFSESYCKVVVYIKNREEQRLHDAVSKKLSSGIY